MRKTILFLSVIGLLMISCEKDNDDNDNQNSEDSTVVDTIGNDSTDNSSDTSQNNNNLIIDGDGNVYTSVVIDELEWLVENLRTGTYNDGSPITQVTDGKQWIELDSPAWCWYDNDSLNEKNYGKLYNWYAGADTNSKNICPIGWHVPAKWEWDLLKDYLTKYGYEGNEGIPLKSTDGWYNEDGTIDTTGSDRYGFKGLPGGYRWYSINDYFSLLGEAAVFMSSTSYDTYKTYSYGLVDSRFVYEDFNKNYGQSIRCVKD